MPTVTPMIDDAHKVPSTRAVLSNCLGLNAMRAILGIGTRTQVVLCMCLGPNHRPMFPINTTQTRNGRWVVVILDRCGDAVKHQGFICRKNACTYSYASLCGPL